MCEEFAVVYCAIYQLLCPNYFRITITFSTESCMTLPVCTHERVRVRTRRVTVALKELQLHQKSGGTMCTVNILVYASPMAHGHRYLSLIATRFNGPALYIEHAVIANFKG